MFLVRRGYDIDEINVEAERLGQGYARLFTVRAVEGEGGERDIRSCKCAIAREFLSAA